MSRPLSLHQLQYQSSYSSYSSASGNPAVQPVPQPYPYDIAQPNLTAPAPQPGTQPQTTFPPADLRQDVQREIDMIRGVLLRLESARRHIQVTADTEIDKIVNNVRANQALKDHLTRLEIKLNALTLRDRGRTSFLFDPVALDKLLELQRDTATKVAALTTVGASLSLSIMYSGARGNMWYPFVAWYMFGGSMVATTSLALATSGFTNFKADDPQRQRQNITGTGVFLRVLSAMAAVFSLTSCGCGWAILSAGTATFDVRGELHGKPAALWGGPEFSTSEFGKIFRVLIYMSIAILCLIAGGCYFLRLTFRFWSTEQEHLTEIFE